MDQVLVERAMHGDDDAFADLVSASFDRMYTVAGLIVVDRALADDAVEAALTAVRVAAGDVRRLPGYTSRRRCPGRLGGIVGSRSAFATGDDSWAPTGGAPTTTDHRSIVTLQDTRGARRVGDRDVHLGIENS